eukprot:CAMPEP_0119133070 /NCGR_PEP_ID=MMETSP1310-20130426/12927_1 /TAXON_ID=464262 /ORGANISM="Genus nov. species nov., Strain RCC2339" /LENGTH=258 /DNA_ID=CAMNT_0007123745 /DNA_START=80 /DNA_END=856 /DNA_ORIENTATION=-
MAELKAKGNKCYAAGDYLQAIEWYTKAIDANPNEHTFYSNRSAAYFALNKFEESVDDARQCVRIAPKWIKGYYRTALSMKELLLFEEAEEILLKGLTVEPNNRDLKDLLTNVRRELSEMQTKAGRGADGKPLSPAAAAKDRGNAEFKNGMHNNAIRWYTRGIIVAKDDERDVKIACYSNRATCYAQTHNYKKVIADATKVLEMEPRHGKCLIRRGLAYEALEKYKLALEDMKLAQQVAPTPIVSQAVTRLTRNVRDIY